jgi:hypothetical protein
MSTHVDLEQAARLHHAERRWLDQCAARLRRATDERRLQDPNETGESDR